MVSPFFLKSAVRTTQPTQSTVLAKTSLTKDLTSLWCGTDGIRDIVDGSNFTITTGWNQSVSVVGSGFRGSSTGSIRATKTPPASANSNSYTVFAYVYEDTGSGVIRNPVDSDWTTRVFQLRFISNDGVEFIVFNSFGTPYFATSGAISWSPRIGLLVGRVENGTNLSVWWQGKNLATGTVASGNAQTLNNGNLFGIANSANNNQGFLGQVLLAGHYNRALTDSEIISLSQNPWQLFQAPTKKFWVPTATGNVSVTLTGSSITGNIGTLKSAIENVLSGNLSTSNTGSVVNTISQGLSGQVVTSSTGTITSAISYTLTGNSANFSTGTITGSTASNVSVNLSGTAVVISSGTLSSAIANTITGNSSTLSSGTLVNTVSPVLSGLSFTGTPGTLTSAISRGLSGNSIAFSTGTLSALTGSIITVKAGSWIRYRTI